MHEPQRILWVGLLAALGTGCAAVGGDVCQADADCGGGGHCLGGTCSALSCSLGSCPDGERCLAGSCYPAACGGSVCGAGMVCLNERCTDPTCEKVTCSEGRQCANGSCYPKVCNGGTCPEGQLCFDGRCVESACAGITCPGDSTCSGGKCASASCHDGQREEDESDVDCGGACSPCPTGRSCRNGGDCQSARCTHGSCEGVASCTDGVSNQSETDVDCGGACPACATGRACRNASDCVSGSCEGQTCKAPISCSDGQQNGDETDIDCGGSCQGCASGKRCAKGGDCGAGLGCSGTTCQSGCSIGGSFFAPGTPNPSEPCLSCQPHLSSVAWSTLADGTTCQTSTCGTWGDCGGFPSTCANSGTQSRACTLFACRSGVCSGSPATESRACTRNTDGQGCGATTCTGWGTCGGYSSTCDNSGTQSRTCTDYVCSGGTCTAPTRPENQGCSRNTNGWSCGSDSNTWGNCSYSGCSTTGTQTHWTTTYTCSSGSCGSNTTSRQETCTRTVQCDGSGTNFCTVHYPAGSCPLGGSLECWCEGHQSCNTSTCTWNSTCVRTSGNPANYCSN